MDDGTSNVTAIGNVWTCFLVHGGASDVYRNNVCDEAGGSNILFYQQTTHTPTSNYPMTGNVFQSTIIVCKARVTCGNGFVGSNSPPAPETNSGNTFWNYGSVTTVTNTGAGGAAGDSSPSNANPGLACRAVAIPGMAVAGWGPPGFAVPHTGTPPSWQHAC